MTEPHDWPAEQSARGTLRPWHYTTVGYLAAVFEDPEEALRAQRGLRDQGVPEAELRLYDAEQTLGIASRLQQERSIVAKAINEGPSPEPIARAVKAIIENPDSDIAVMVGGEAEQFVPLRRSLSDKEFEQKVTATFGLPAAKAQGATGA